METHPKTPAKLGQSRITGLASQCLIFVIRAYQYLLSPWLGNHCRFTPSCSHYAIEAIEKYGSIKGSTLTMKRLSKCHPWHAGGYDPVPDNTVTDKKVGK